MIYVKKMHGLKLSYRNPTFNHDVNDDIISCKYFERVKHAYDFHDIFNDPLHVPTNAKLHSLNGYIVKFVSTECNYYERGGVDLFILLLIILCIHILITCNDMPLLMGFIPI
jgi:hypothetical protein